MRAEGLTSKRYSLSLDCWLPQSRSWARFNAGRFYCLYRNGFLPLSSLVALILPHHPRHSVRNFSALWLALDMVTYLLGLGSFVLPVSGAVYRVVPLVERKVVEQKTFLSWRSCCSQHFARESSMKLTVFCARITIDWQAYLQGQRPFFQPTVGPSDGEFAIVRAPPVTSLNARFWRGTRESTPSR